MEKFEVRQLLRTDNKVFPECTSPNHAGTLWHHSEEQKKMMAAEWGKVIDELKRPLPATDCETVGILKATRIFMISSRLGRAIYSLHSLYSSIDTLTLQEWSALRERTTTLSEKVEVLKRKVPPEQRGTRLARRLKPNSSTSCPP
jgi:hypothetical protein